ncbi:glycogen synthase GlgA [Mariniblastus fucicola]|uniref:Glycogen synthase n=1 Tax=Mariniblastus fucicola TaxID=980251 RepID=A0A5B9P4V8_9BACT|nr:glycogen synthase GlgA [Mariniblastus fucicola]QEG20175.1 Glycogen synthase [Mariniblastus fucicola]
MKIILASSEVVPFAKTGGLADVCGALPRELENLGHEVNVFMPYYRCVKEKADKFQIEDTRQKLEIPVGSLVEDGQLLRTTVPNSNVPVWLVGHDEYFNRDGLYGENGQDYQDNCERFTFFCRSVMESIRILDLQPDLIHVNDWQTGLIPALLKCEYHQNPIYENVASLMTVHNLAYQGTFVADKMAITGLDWKHFNYEEMEFYGRLNLLKTGLVYADAINTVSPTYAKEIQSPAQGCGLETVLQHRSADVSGIINGIDDTAWNPAVDELISQKFDRDSWPVGKAACKAEVQKLGQLHQNPDVPMIGIVGRLATQKGWSLILPVMRRWLEDPNNHAQWVVLGTGDPDFHVVLSTLQQQFAGQLSVTLDFSNQLAHQIEAGSDIFVMPSEYEPCGLNQMYSMAYGTVPVVRSTGGLADTVVDASLETLGNGTANGFSFADFSADALEHTLHRAARMYYEDKECWRQLVNQGMSQDWSWTASAKAYEALYGRLTKK